MAPSVVTVVIILFGPLVTMTEYLPRSDSATLTMTSVAPVAPGTGFPSSSHWKVGGGVPVADTASVTVWPIPVSVFDAGFFVTFGLTGTSMASVAALLVTEPLAFLIVTV
jgi:hypothetical protein